MRLNMDEIHYRIRTDNQFKKKLKRLVVIGGIGILGIAVLGIVGIFLFSSAIISFLFTHAPGLYELGFNNVREFVSSFLLEDITAMLNPLSGGANVNEMKNLVAQYFNQLGTNPAVDYQNFQNFITTVKTSLLDSQITDAELQLVQQFVVN